MRITAIRVRKLISGPNFSNLAVEAEIAPEPWEDADAARERLSAWVDAQLGKMRERDVLVEDVTALRREVVSLEQRRQGMKEDIDAARKVIREHEKLRELAVKNGIDQGGFAQDEITF